MILADIGNTSIHFGIEKNEHLIDTFRLYNKDITLSLLRSKLKKYKFQEIIACSVAPSISCYFKRLRRKVYFVGKDIIVPVKSLYNKNEIGQDRLVNVFSALYFYPQAKIIVDFGTAITVDFISKKGAYLGGFIFPGINLYLRSLGRCELLPDNIKLIECGSSFIPKNTLSSISEGVKEGFPLMVNSFILKYKKILEKKQRVKKIDIIVTGGESYILQKKLDFPYIYDPLLTLKGLLRLKKII